MKPNQHEQARLWIACSGAEGLTELEQASLNDHLRSCADCRNFADRARRVVQSMRAVPIAADRSLVRATQLRVHARARELRERRERTLLVAGSFAVVGILSALTTTILWQAFAWLTDATSVSNLAWIAGFVVFWVAPSIAMSLAFLAHGTHLSSGQGAN